MNTDLFSFSDANQNGGIGLMSSWTSHWQTSIWANDYQKAGTNAQKVTASLTAKTTTFGALSIGASGGRDSGIIPKRESFFDLDKGWKLRERGLIRGVEMGYTQHWYWYTTARILTLSETAVLYLPKEWTWSLKLTEAQSHFYGAGAEWHPAGMVRLGFPITDLKARRLSGATFFAVGTETFGSVDQIGRFASQTYGGTLLLDITRRQEITGYTAYQKRTNNRSETSFGFIYGIRF